MKMDPKELIVGVATVIVGLAVYEMFVKKFLPAR